MEDVTDANYMLVKRVCKDFEINDLGEYHDLYLKGNALLSQMFFKTLEKCA